MGREAHNWRALSRRELRRIALRADFTLRQVGRWVRGERAPHLRTAVALVEARAACEGERRAEAKWLMLVALLEAEPPTIAHHASRVAERSAQGRPLPPRDARAGRRRVNRRQRLDGTR